jgi:hypothetical protein
VIIDEYVPPVDDKLLYWLAHKINIYGNGDVDEMVQEGRIKVWQLWQEAQWVRTCEPRSKSFYAKAAQRRMQAICYNKTRTFGGINRSGYMDMLNHIDVYLDSETFVEPCPAM